MNFFINLTGAVEVAGALILSPVLHRWFDCWGATCEEVAHPLPGDELVPAPTLDYTRALTIQASPERIWPWLAQMGQGRGGLYSYDGLENLAGCDIHTVEHLVPALQDLQVGELIRLGPQGYPCFAVALVDPARALILISADPQTNQKVEYNAQPSKGYSIATWQFILKPMEKEHTRLLVRQRLSYSSDLTWIWRLTEPVGFIMERKMMLGIRQRAERNP